MTEVFETFRLVIAESLVQGDGESATEGEFVVEFFTNGQDLFSEITVFFQPENLVFL